MPAIYLHSSNASGFPPYQNNGRRIIEMLKTFLTHLLNGQVSRANIFVPKAGWAALGYSVLEQWIGEPECKPLEISEKRSFTRHGNRRGEASFTLNNTLAFLPLSGQILLKKAC